MIFVLGVLGWLACTIYFAGTAFAYFQGEYASIASFTRRQDMGFAWGIGLLGGPISAAVGFFFSGFNQHGWRLR